MKNFERILEKVGLDARESVVYLDLLHHPFSSMTDISHRTGIHRPVLYSLLPVMKERGIIFTKDHGKRTLYHASAPAALQEIVREAEAKLQSILPDIQYIYDSQGEDIRVMHHSGVSGIQKIYQEIVDMLPEDGEYFAYTGKNALADTKLFTKKFWETRDRKRLRRFVIAPTDRIPFFAQDTHREVVYFQK